MELSDEVTEANVLALIMNSKNRDVVADVFARIKPDFFYLKSNRDLFLLLEDCYIEGIETTHKAVDT